MVAGESFERGTELDFCQIAHAQTLHFDKCWLVLVGVIFTIHIMQREKIFK